MTTGDGLENPIEALRLVSTVPAPQGVFTTHAVRISDGRKHRFLVGSYDSEDEARREARRVTCGEAQHAYVQAPTGATVFYLETPAAAYLIREPEKFHIRAPRPPDED
jgi:hypothetical protein